MQKTTVYLSDEQVAALKRRSTATGKSQSELIREGVDLVTEGVPRRVFHSMGAGDSGDPTLVERFDEILGEELEKDLEEQLRYRRDADR